MHPLVQLHLTCQLSAFQNLDVLSLVEFTAVFAMVGNFCQNPLAVFKWKLLERTKYCFRKHAPTLRSKVR